MPRSLRVANSCIVYNVVLSLELVILNSAYRTLESRYSLYRLYQRVATLRIVHSGESVTTFYVPFTVYTAGQSWDRTTGTGQAGQKSRGRKVKKT